MTRSRLRVCALATLVCAAFAAQAADLSVRLDAQDVRAKRVHTIITLAVKPGPLTLAFPKWIPGEHGPTGPLESLVGLEIRAGGAPLAWSRDPLDMYALRLTVPAGIDHLAISLESGLAVEDSGFTAGRTSSDRLAILRWNEFLLLPKGIDAEKLTVAATVVPPAGWQLACALRSRLAAGGAYELEGASVARLVDSPMQIGLLALRIELPGSAPAPELAHSLSIMADAHDALVVPPDFTDGYAHLVAEAGALFGSRPYRHYTWILTLSDHLHHDGLEHHESSDNRVDLGALGTAEGRMSVARLLGHEYVHSWNGKYRRPQGLLSPDFQRPVDSSLLWVYEGMTQFWEEVLPTRAGLVSEEHAREVMAHEAAPFDFAPGARWRPLGDTAVAAQVLYPAPDAFAADRRAVDFYDASVFLWLDVDAELRARSGGRASLDDFVRRFYAAENGAPALKPYTERELLDSLAAVAPADWRSLIHRHLDRPDPAALFAALARSGWKLVYSATENARGKYLDGREKHTTRLASIGLSLDKDGKLIDVAGGRAAALAGAAPGMQLVAVNGQRYSAETLDAAIVLAHETGQPTALLVSSGDFYRTLVIEYYGGPRYPHLERIPGTPDTLAALFAPRMPPAAP